MNNLSVAPQIALSGFAPVAHAFLAGRGLPFAEVLGVEELQDAFAKRDGLFAVDRSYSTALVLWAFLAQTLRDGNVTLRCLAASWLLLPYTQQEQLKYSGMML